MQSTIHCSSASLWAWQTESLMQQTAVTLYANRTRRHGQHCTRSTAHLSRTKPGSVITPAIMQQPRAIMRSPGPCTPERSSLSLHYWSKRRRLGLLACHCCSDEGSLWKWLIWGAPTTCTLLLDMQWHVHRQLSEMMAMVASRLLVQLGCKKLLRQLPF